MTLLLGTLVSVVLPAPDAAFATGVVAALLTVLVVSAVCSAAIVPAGLRARTRARAVLDRMTPRAAQSDPDARGHARPRAPGALLPAG